MGEVVRTDRRIVRTKEAITRSFLELFVEKEFDQITINEIADRANVNRGTIYLHYNDKYDLLDKCVEDHLNRLISLCKGREASPDAQGMLGEPKPIFDYFRDHILFFSAMFSNERAHVFRDKFLHFISANLLGKIGQANSKLEVDDELNAQFMSSAFIGIVEWWIRQQMPYSTEFMADQVRKLFEKNKIYKI